MINNYNIHLSIDKIADYTPLVSTFTNITALFLKYLVLPNLEEQTVKESPILTLVQKKSTARSLILLLPFLGNVIVFCLDCKASKQQTKTEKSKKVLVLPSSYGKAPSKKSAEALLEQFKTTYLLPLQQGKISLNKNTAKEHVENLVQIFLEPYITGQITRETDPENRSPLATLLYDAMKTHYKELVSKKTLQNIAYHAFIKQAALGLYLPQNHADDETLKNTTPKNPSAKNRLIQALEEALPREFPDLKLPKEQLLSKINKAIELIDIGRELDYLHSEMVKDQIAGDPKNRKKTLQQLKEQKRLFLQS